MIRHVVTYPTGASTFSAESMVRPSGIPRIVTSTSTATNSPTIPISAPQPNEAAMRLPAAAAVSAARGSRPTNTRPSRAIEMVTAIHRYANVPMMRPVNSARRSTRRTSPSTVPRAICGSRRDTTSPPTLPFDVTTTRPLSATTSPPTRPVIRALPWRTRTPRVTRPRTTTSPSPTITKSVTVPATSTSPSAVATGPSTVSPRGTSMSPVTLMMRSALSPRLRANAGDASAMHASSASATTATTWRRRM